MGGFGQILKNMMNYQPSGSPAWQRQQQMKIQQAQEARAAQQADITMHQYLSDLGAQPVVHGMVKESQPMAPLTAVAPDQDGGDSGPNLPRLPDFPSYGPGSPDQSTPSTPPNFRTGAPGTPATNAPPALSWQSDGDAAPQAAGGNVTSQQLMQAMMPAPAAGNMTIVRKADPAQTVKWKDHTGDEVAYELPTIESQRWRQMMAARQQALAQGAGMTEQATTAGAGAGRTQAQTADLAARGIKLPDELADLYKMPRGISVLPEQLAQMSERATPASYRYMGTTEAADTRAQSAADVAGTRAQSATDVAGIRANSAQTLQQAKQLFADQQNSRRLDFQNQWAAQRNALAWNTQGSLNNRTLLRQFDSQQQEHGRLLDQAYKEGQKQLDAQPLLDPNATPDGTQFTDPWSGKSMSMNYAQRLRLQNALGASQAQVADWGTRASQIAKRYGLGANPAGPAGGPSGASTGAPSSTAAPSSGGTGAGPSAAQPSAAAPAVSAPTWADGGRASTGGAALLPGRAAPSSQTTPAAASAPSATPAPVQYKVGDTRVYNGRTYKFDGKQWKGQ